MRRDQRTTLWGICNLVSFVCVYVCVCVCVYTHIYIVGSIAYILTLNFYVVIHKYISYVKFWVLCHVYDCKTLIFFNWGIFEARNWTTVLLLMS